MKKLFTLIFIFSCLNSFTQKKILDHSDFDIWNRIQSPQIASEGNHILYSIQTGEKDSKLMLKDKQGNLIFHYDRSENGVFTYDYKFALFKINAWKDSITEMKRRKVKKDRIPLDTLGIFSIDQLILQKIGNVKSYKIPEKWSGFIAYTYEIVKGEEEKKNQDSKISIKNKSSKKIKKPSSSDHSRGTLPRSKKSSDCMAKRRISLSCGWTVKSPTRKYALLSDAAARKTALARSSSLRRYSRE